MEVWPFSAPTKAITLNKSHSVLETSGKGNHYKAARFNDTLAVVGVSFRISDYDFELFQSWHAHKVKRGNSRFTITLPLSDGFNTYVVTIDHGKYSATYLPTKRRSNEPFGWWSLSFKLNIPDKSTSKYGPSPFEGLTTSSSVVLSHVKIGEWPGIKTEGLTTTTSVALTATESAEWSGEETEGLTTTLSATLTATVIP